jgi:hypothetical protein
VAADSGELLDAFVTLSHPGNGVVSITFESQGGGRNTDYIPAHNVVVTRLIKLNATLIDALVVSSETRHLSEEQRRFRLGDGRFPVVLGPTTDPITTARRLRRAAAEVGRRHDATGPGNRAKRVELRFSLANLENLPDYWLDEQLLFPSGAGDAKAVLEAARPSAAGDVPPLMRDALARKAVELRAMQVAMEHLRKSWSEVADVSATESYDVRCRSKGSELHVEVKGTTSNGASVVVTRNEVEHARAVYPSIALFVVSNILLQRRGDAVIATGGVLRSYDPWIVDAHDLRPLAFQCFLLPGV